MPNIKHMKSTLIFFLLFPIITFSNNFTDSLLLVQLHPNWAGWSDIVIEEDENVYSLNITIKSRDNNKVIELHEKTQIDVDNISLVKDFFNKYNYTQDTSMISYCTTENGDTVVILNDATDNKRRLYVFGEYYRNNRIKKFNFRKPLTNKPDIDLIVLIFNICYDNIKEDNIINYIKDMEVELKNKNTGHNKWYSQ